ncbi:MAG TPA: tetratricopeptide repeat protein [Pirellulales bacterium]|jgi:Flp pilus assembly protein TadD
MSKRKRPPLRSQNQPPAAAQTVWTPQFQQWLGALAIVGLVWLVYSPSLKGDFLLDDDLLLTNNKLIQSSSGLSSIWFSTEPTDYWPVTNTSLWIEWRLWEASPHGYRVINLLLHLVDVFLLWAVLARLSVPGAFLAALLFAVHPINVESVAWIAQRKNLLALLFSLASVWLYLNRKPSSQRLFDRWVWLSLAAFVLAMLSKGSAAVLPLALVSIIWWQQRRIGKHDWVRLAPFFVVAAALTAVNIWFQSHDFSKIVRHANPLERLLAAADMIWFYLGKAVAPIHLSFVYRQWNITAGDFGAWVALAAVAVVTAALFWRRNTHWGRAVLFAWLFFCIALLPVLGFTDVAYMQWSLVADHYQHIALIAVVALVACAITLWMRQPRTTARRGAAVAAVALVCGLSLLAFWQSQLYASPIALYSAALRENPDSVLLNNLLGTAYLNDEQFADAIDCFERTIKLQPDNVEALDNLGLALLNRNQTEAAISRFQQALKLKPDEAAAHNGYGLALLKTGNFPAALEQFRTAVKLMPDRFDFLSNLGNAQMRNDKYAEAVQTLEAALALNPDSPSTHLLLAGALAKSGNLEQARAHYLKALRLNPQLQSSFPSDRSALPPEPPSKPN